MADDETLPGVKNIVAVASGKGGVGKSTTAVNLALALKGDGATVGFLDADVYGPSAQMMLGVDGPLTISSDQKLIPAESQGIKVISMALLQDPSKAVIWRGPMVHNLLQQFARSVAWGELDYLVVDLPPGTGDAQLSLSQVLQITGAIIVSTPQEVSLLDARKGLMAFRELRVPVLGIVENMSYFVCEKCDHRTEIFSHGGAQRLCQEIDVDFLGEIPLDPRVVLGGDQGKPIVVEHPDSPAALAYKAFAATVAAQLDRARGEERPTQTPMMPGKIEWE